MLSAGSAVRSKQFAQFSPVWKISTDKNCHLSMDNYFNTLHLYFINFMKLLSFHPSSLPRSLNKFPEKALPFIVSIGSHSLVLTANLASMHFCYLLQITDKQDRSKDRPMWQLSCYQLLGIVWSINHYPEFKHAVFYPPSCPCHTVHQILNWIHKYYGSHNSLVEVQENDISYSPLVPGFSHSDMEGTGFGQVCFVLNKSMLSIPSYVLLYGPRHISETCFMIS